MQVFYAVTLIWALLSVAFGVDCARLMAVAVDARREELEDVYGPLNGWIAVSATIIGSVTFVLGEVVVVVVVVTVGARAYTAALIWGAVVTALMLTGTWRTSCGENPSVADLVRRGIGRGAFLFISGMLPISFFVWAYQVWVR